MSAQFTDHRDYQQLASRIAELNATLQAMETQLQVSQPASQASAASSAKTVVETPLAIAAG